VSFLLDTNVCIAAMNDRPANMRDRLNKAVAHSGKATVSTLTIFELRFGIAKSTRIASNAERLDLFLSSLQILSFDQEDARVAGNIRAELERAGRPIGPYDYLIAAQAIRHDLTLITANEKEFARVPGLRWENWTS
jgi:tRNA(fMet)-specific endonuclease VapC